MSIVLAYMARATGLSTYEARRLIAQAPERYKIFYIDKKSGGRRQIAQPAREIKFLQRVFMRSFLDSLPIHDAATAYRKGMSLAENAKPHVHAGPILKMDFRDFFPSIRSRDWSSYCSTHGIFESPEDIRLSERLLFFRPPGGRVLRLSIGAPTSPMLSNILMFEFDRVVSELVAKDHVTYTRYADDMTFSAPRTGHLVNVQRDVASAVRSISFPKLEINRDKTTYVTKKYHRQITGLTISNDGRVTIGRDFKRKISAKVHHYITGKLPDLEIRRLAGHLAHINSVEPEFLSALEAKYGAGTLEEIRDYAALVKSIEPEA